MTTYARIKQENGKTFLVDAEGKELGQVVPVEPTQAMKIIGNDDIAEGFNAQSVYRAMLSAATVDVSAAIVKMPHKVNEANRMDAYYYNRMDAYYHGWNAAIDAMEGK